MSTPRGFKIEFGYLKGVDSLSGLKELITPSHISQY
jgi:hypothetical protein